MAFIDFSSLQETPLAFEDWEIILIHCELSRKSLHLSFTFLVSSSEPEPCALISSIHVIKSVINIVRHIGILSPRY